MNLLQAILRTVADKEATSGFKVSSIWATDKCIVLENNACVIEAKRNGTRLCEELKFLFPDVLTQLHPPDADGTTLDITY